MCSTYNFITGYLISSESLTTLKFAPDSQLYHVSASEQQARHLLPCTFPDTTQTKSLCHSSMFARCNLLSRAYTPIIFPFCISYSSFVNAPALNNSNSLANSSVSVRPFFRFVRCFTGSATLCGGFCRVAPSIPSK